MTNRNTKIYKIGKTYTVARCMAEALIIKKACKLSGVVTVVEINKLAKEAV